MKLSIITTMYYSSPYLNEFYNRIKKASEKITKDYEIIFVNDGSPDDSLDIVLKLYENDNKIKIIDLSRNFGHHKAIMTGLKYAEGDYIFLIDCDLEEAPELLIKFNDEIIKNNDIDVVFGIQEKRKGRLFEKISGFLFYIFFNFLSDNKIKKNLSIVRIMTYRYVQELIKFTEYHPVLSGLFILSGFNQKSIFIKKKYKGKTTYNLTRKIKLTIDSIVSFSVKPLLFVFNIGLVILTISFILIVKIFFDRVFNSIKIGGWTSLMISLWFLGGFIIFSIGLVGLYLSKIFEQVKNRPYSIIKKIYKKNN